MTEEFKTKIIEKLHEVGANNPCPRCGNVGFDFVGVTRQAIGESDYNNLDLTMPMAVTGCKKCAFVAYHALIPLGLSLDDKEEE